MIEGQNNDQVKDQRRMLHDGWGKHTPKHRFKTNNASAKQTLN